MLPPQPSPRPRGLPSNPRARTRIDQVDLSTDMSASSPTRSPVSARLRTRTPGPSPGQVTFPANATRTRSRSRPPTPEYRTTKRGNSPNREHVRAYAPSNASSSSVASSLFSRGRQDGYSSSRTSLDDDDELSKRGRSLRSSPVLTGDTTESDRPDEWIESGRIELEPASSPETGYSVWNAVATAASTLTLTVSKAWATNVTSTADEETPPGQESHLTQVMKAYHLQKAQELDDLPDWLFPGVKCRSVTSPRSPDGQTDDGLKDETSTPQAAGRRCLREVYRDALTAADGLPTPAGAARVARHKPDFHTDDAPGRSKATDRLKALRDAKRNVLAPNQHGDSMVEPTGQRNRSAAGGGDLRRRPHMPRSAGLPSRPMARH